MLRALRQSGTGGPSLLARLIALLVVLGMLAVVAPTLLVPVGRWFSTLF